MVIAMASAHLLERFGIRDEPQTIGNFVQIFGNVDKINVLNM